jgi:ABC-type sugar transport system permease subunit
LPSPLSYDEGYVLTNSDEMPLVHSIYPSLHEHVLARSLDNDFVGLQNFREVVTGYYFWRSLWSTPSSQ